MQQVAQRIVLIVLFGSLLGFVSNAVSPKRIPLIAPPKKAALLEEFLPLPKAHEMWAGGSTIFIDAREPEDFEAGHVANALNLPVQHFEEHFPKVAPMLSPESPIVVYCDGTECELSHRLSKELGQRGFTNSFILFNGWTAWRNAGFPTDTGPGK